MVLPCSGLRMGAVGLPSKMIAMATGLAVWGDPSLEILFLLFALMCSLPSSVPSTL